MRPGARSLATRCGYVRLAELRGIIAKDTALAWERVVRCRPSGSVLMGGTALAVHLRHRVSHDLDLFCHEPFDPIDVAAALANHGPFARTPPVEAHTLNGLIGRTKVQFLTAVDQTVLRPPIKVAGMPVGSLEDVFATNGGLANPRSSARSTPVRCCSTAVLDALSDLGTLLATVGDGRLARVDRRWLVGPEG